MCDFHAPKAVLDRPYVYTTRGKMLGQTEARHKTRLLVVLGLAAIPAGYIVSKRQ
jgi:hypothetical protein